MALTRRYFLQGALYTTMIAPVAGCITSHPPPVTLSAGHTVLALGDSITFGTGAAPQDSYPSVLADITGWNVVNAGIPGDTSKGALKRLPWLLKKYNPDLVLTCIGINDFMTEMPVEKVKINIQRICQIVRSHHTQQMLINVPYMTPQTLNQGTLQNAELYAEVAQEFDIPLQQNALLYMLSTPGLLSDFVHGNADGYHHLAYEIATSLYKEGLLRKNPAL